MWRTIAAFAICAAGARGQSDAPQQPPSTTPPDNPPSSKIQFQGSFRTRLEVWNWFTPDSGQNQYEFSGNYLRLGLSQTTDRWDWMAELEVPFLLALPTNSVASGAQGQLGLGATYYVANNKNAYTAMIFPKQLFYRWKNIGEVTGQSLRIGRFEASDGGEHAPRNSTLSAVKNGHINQRLIGPFGYTHTGRTFDGVQYLFDRPQNNFTFWGAVPDRGGFQTDGWGWLRIAFGYMAYTHEWGKGPLSAETRLFAIEYYDYRDIAKVDNRPPTVRNADTGNLNIQTFGGHSIHAVETRAGTADFMVWGAVQTGRWGLLDHRASAFVSEGGFQPKGLDKLKPWIRSGITIGSGSADPNGRTHGTFFQMLPTARIYARFPLFNMMNIQDAYGALVLRPHPKVSISTEYHSLRLKERNDLWYSSGGAYQPWSFGFTGRDAQGAASLANLYDTQADFKVTNGLSATLYFGYAQGLAALRAIYPRGKDGQYGFVEMTYRF